MTVVPRVVVHQCGPVSHARYLVAVVPPGHDACVFVSVLPQPVVGLPEVVQDVPGSIRVGRGRKKKLPVKHKHAFDCGVYEYFRLNSEYKGQPESENRAWIFFFS